MRIELKKGKQMELILEAKKSKTWKKLSRVLSISEGYLISELKNERRLLSGFLYKKLCKLAQKDYSKEIIEILDDNWGKIKGGKISKGKTKKINIPKDSLQLAEFYGIMLGDGNLTKIKAYKVGTYEIRIVGDSRKDAKYLKEYVKPLIEKLFFIKVTISKRKNENALVLVAQGKVLVEFLESKGFKPGNKIKNKLVMPPWIKENKEFLKACIRGLYDTDGCVYQLTNQNSYQICLTNYNNYLLNDVRNSLVLLNIGVSKIIRGRDIVITKKSELRKFLKGIGFSNPKHLDKVSRWNIAL